MSKQKTNKIGSLIIRIIIFLSITTGLINYFFFKNEVMGNIIIYLFASFFVAVVIEVIFCMSINGINSFREHGENKTKELEHNYSRTIFWLMIAFPYFMFRIYFGPMEIDSIFERYSYKTQYYVNVWADSKDAKNYRIKADIESTGNEFNRTYRIYKAYWPNGGYLSFEDSLRDEVEINNKILLIDQNKRFWYVELTNEKVK